LKTLPDKLTDLKGVGPALAGKLNRLGIGSPEDLLFHLPMRYEDRTHITAIGSCRIGDTVLVEGVLDACDVAYGRRRSLLAYVSDGTGRVGLRFYYFSGTQQKNLKRARRVRAFGEIRRGASGPEIYHPEYQVNPAAGVEETLTPVYPATEGVTQARLRSLITPLLTTIDEPSVIQEITQLPGATLAEALRIVHKPQPNDDIASLLQGTHPAQKRLAFEELLAHQASMRLLRRHIGSEGAPVMKGMGSELATRFDRNMDFTLTTAQDRVLKEIAADMVQPLPMFRLLQGDVGSGKTIVAARTAVDVIESGYQVAIMAPTEILAEQHLLSFSEWLLPLGIEIAWLTGKVSGRARAQTLSRIASGDAPVIIGTHALFADDVMFHQLGLIVVDEQHRFGVQQRLSLREKGRSRAGMPHQLIMTATPIPRTLTMTLYSDMDVSIIEELPPGRIPVSTSVIPDKRRGDIVARVNQACAEGQQVYWVCTLIEDSDDAELQAAEETARMLTEALPDHRVALVHGRLKAQEKSDIMQRFREHSFDVLVATTVIEVGVNVPNANLMIIDNAERLGLAQLHQLRGRVGRGHDAGFCVLLYQPPLGPTAKARLDVMRRSTDGFLIAEQDLLIRGPGDILGERQSGDVQFRVADLIRDQDLLTEIRNRAATLTDSECLILMARWMRDPENLAQV